MTTAVAPSIEVSPVGNSASDIDACVRLFAASFPGASKYSLAYLSWQYGANPLGPPVGFNAIAGGEVVAHYVCVPMQMRVAGVAMPALLSLNTATRPDFQGKGLFTKLAAATYARGKELGYGFVYGVANANSTPGFTRKLGFQLVEPLYAGFLFGPLPRASTAPGDSPALASAWTEQTLAWRLRNPAGRYARCGSGWIAARTDRASICCVAPDPIAGRHGGLGLSAAPPLRARLFIGTECGIEWRSTVRIAIPKRFRPSPLNLIYLPLADAVPKTIDRAAVSFLDFDPY